MNVSALLLAATGLLAQTKAAAPAPATAAAAAPAAGPAKPVLLDGIVAVVEDVTFFRSDVAQRLHHLESRLSKDPTERRAQQKDLSRQVVRKLVDEVLVARDCARMKLDVSDA